MTSTKSTYPPPPPPPPQSVQRLIQLCIGSWSSVVGSSDVMRPLHTSARPVSRQGTVAFDPRVPVTPQVPLRCVRYYDAEIRLRSTETLCTAGSGVAHSGGLCTLDDPMQSWIRCCTLWGGGGGGYVLLLLLYCTCKHFDWCGKTLVKTLLSLKYHRC